MIELREASDGFTLHGLASRTEVAYPVGGYDEVIRRGAFRATLAESPSVVLTLNHSRGGTAPLASTVSGTLRLAETYDGLEVNADLDPERSDARDIALAVKRGDLADMSFAFQVVSQHWSSDFTKREIKEVDLAKGDVSLVDFGANPSTSAMMRADQMTLEQRRAAAEKLGTELRGFAHIATSRRSSDTDALLAMKARAGIARARAGLPNPQPSPARGEILVARARARLARR